MATAAATAGSSGIDVSKAPTRTRPTMSFSLPSNSIGNTAVEAKENNKNVINGLPLFAKPSNLDGTITGTSATGRSPSLQKSSSVMISIHNNKKTEETTGSSSFINNRSIASYPAWDADSIKKKIHKLYAIALSHGDALYYQSECDRIETLFKEGKRQEQREKMRERRKREIMALGRDKSKSANAIGPRLGVAQSGYVTAVIENTAQSSSSDGAILGDLHTTAITSGSEKVSKKLSQKSTTNSFNRKKNKDGLLDSDEKGDFERSNADTSMHGVQSVAVTTDTIRDRLVFDEQNWDTIGDTPSDFERVMPTEGPTLCEAKKIRRQLLTWKRYEAFVESCGFYEASGEKAASAGVTSLFCRRAWIRQVMAGREEENKGTSITSSKNAAVQRGDDEGSQHRREETRNCQAREPPVPSRVFLFDKTLSADGNEVQCQQVSMRGGGEGGKELGGAWGARDSVGAAAVEGNEITGRADGSRRDVYILNPSNSPRSPSRVAAAARRQSVALPRSKQSRPSRASVHSLALTEDDVEDGRDILLDNHKTEAGGLRSTVSQSHAKAPRPKLEEGKKEELLRRGGGGKSREKGKGPPPPTGIGQSLFLPSKGLVNTLTIADEEVEEARALMRVAPPIKSIAIQATPFFSGGSSAKTPSEVYLRATNNDEDDVATLASARGHAPAIDRLAIAYANAQGQRSPHAQGLHPLNLGAPPSPRSESMGGATSAVTGGLSGNNTCIFGNGSTTPPYQPHLTNNHAGHTYNTNTPQNAHRLSAFRFGGGGGGNDSAEDWCSGGTCIMYIRGGDQHMDVAGYGYGYCASSSSGGGCYCGRGCGLNVGLAAGFTSLRAMDDDTPNAVANASDNDNDVDDEEDFPFSAITRAQFTAIIVEMVERLMLPPSAAANAKTSPSSSFIQPASVPTQLRRSNNEQQQAARPPSTAPTLPYAPHLGAAYGQKALSFPTSPSRQQIANVDYEARFTAAWQFLYSNFFKPLESLTTSSSALGEVMAIANVDLAPRPLRSTQRVVYHLLAAHLEWLLIPLFDRYCELGCNYMTKDAFLCFASDLRLGELDRDLAIEIFDKTNRYDTEGMLENTKLENLEFDEFVDAVLLIGCAQFGDVDRFPTIVTVHAKVWETFRILRRRFGELVVVPTEGGNKMDAGNTTLPFKDTSGTPVRKKGPGFNSITAGLGGTEDRRVSIVGRGSTSTWGNNSPPRQKNNPSPCFGASGATPVDREEIGPPSRGGGALHSRRSTLGSSATPHAGPFGWMRGDITAPVSRERSKMQFIFRFSDRNISYIRQRRRPRVSIVAPSSSGAVAGVSSGGPATTATTAASLASLSLDFYNLAHPNNPPSAEREKYAGVGDGNEATAQSYSKFSSVSDVGLVGGKNSSSSPKISTPLSAFGNANNSSSSSAAAFAATVATHLDDGLIRNPRDILVFRAATHESPLALPDVWAGGGLRAATGARPYARSSCYSNSSNNPFSSSSSAHQPFREVAAVGSAPFRSDELLGVLVPPTTDLSELRRELLMDAFPSTVSEGFLEMSPDEVQLKWDLCGRVNPNKSVLSALAPTLHRRGTMTNAISISPRHSVGGGLLAGGGQSLASHGQTAVGNTEESGIKNGGLSSVSDVPRIPTQLTLVCPREICVDDLSSFLIGGIFLPNLSSLRDTLSSRLSIVSTFNASSPLLTKSRPTVSTPRSTEGIGRGRTVLFDNDASEGGFSQISGSKQIPAAPPSTPPNSTRPTSSFFVTQSSPSFSSRVTTGGFLPTPPPQQGGVALRSVGAIGSTALSPRTPRLRQRSRSNSRRDEEDQGIVEASIILAKASRVTALLDALSPIQVPVTDKAGAGMRPLSTGGSTRHVSASGQRTPMVAPNEPVTLSATDGATTLSPLCPISVLLGPRGVEGKAIQVARNRWKVTVPLGSVNPRAYLPIVEAQLTSSSSSSPSWTSPQQQCLPLGSRFFKLVTKPSQRWRVRLSAKEGSEAYVSPPTIEHSIQLELKAVVDSLTPHQSEWLFTLFNTFADRESRLLTISQFREHVLPQFVTFPLVTNVASTLLRTEPLLYPTHSSLVSSSSSSPQAQQQADQSRCLHPDAPRSPLEDLFMCFCTSEQSTRVCLEATVNGQIAISHVLANADGSSIAAISPTVGTTTPSNSKRRWRVATYPQSQGGAGDGGLTAVDGGSRGGNSPNKGSIKGLLVTSSLVHRPSVGLGGSSASSGGVGASVAEAATEKLFPSFFDGTVRYEDREGVSIAGFLVFIAYAILGKKATQGGYDQPATVAFADIVEQMMPIAIKERNLLLASHGINAALATPRSCRTPSQKRPEALTAFTSSDTDNTTGAAAGATSPSVSASGLTPRRGGRRTVRSPKKKVPPKNASPMKSIKQVSAQLLQTEGESRKVGTEDLLRSPANKMPHPPSTPSPPEGVSGKPKPLSAGLLAYSEALLSSSSPHFSSSSSFVPQSSAASAILGGVVGSTTQSGNDTNKEDKEHRTAFDNHTGGAVAMGASYMPSTAEVNAFLATQARRAERRREAVSTLVPVGGAGGGSNICTIHEDTAKSKAVGTLGVDEQSIRNKVQLGSREKGAQLPYPTILKSVFLSSHTSPLDDVGGDEDEASAIMFSPSSPTKEDNREPNSAEIIAWDIKHDHDRYAVRAALPAVHTLDLQHTIYSLSDVGGGSYGARATVAPPSPPPPLHTARIGSSTTPTTTSTPHRHGAQTAANTTGKNPLFVVSTPSPSSPSASLALRGGLTSTERTLLSLEEEHFSRVMLSTSESHGVATAGGRNLGGGGGPDGKMLLGGFDHHQFTE